MPNNFRLTGDRYISKDGNDANSGTTPDLPEATLADYSVATHVVGSGVYRGAFSFNTAVTSTFLWDGMVKIDCTGNFVVGNTVTSARPKTLGNLTTSSRLRIVLNGFNLLNTPVNATNIYNNTIISNGTVSTASTGSATWNNCIFTDITGTLNGVQTFSRSQIYNAELTLLNTHILTNCYVDNASVIIMSSYYSSPATQFTNCNILGKFIVNGIVYELKLDRDGNVRPDANDSIRNINEIDATVYDRGNFAQDAEHLNLEKRDYWSVSETSPMLFGDSVGTGNIAGTYFSSLVKATDTEFADGVIVDLVSSAQDLILDTGEIIGTVTSLPIQDAPIPQAWGVMTFASLFNFNSDFTAGLIDNTNVLAVQNYADGNQGANPRRLTYEMRWSNKNTIPLVDADWDNQGYITAGSYGRFEVNSQPRVDNAGYGNGSPEFNPSNSSGLKWKWRQMRITILNGIG